MSMLHNCWFKCTILSLLENTMYKSYIQCIREDNAGLDYGSFMLENMGVMYRDLCIIM